MFVAAILSASVFALGTVPAASKATTKAKATEQPSSSASTRGQPVASKPAGSKASPKLAGDRGPRRAAGLDAGAPPDADAEPLPGPPNLAVPGALEETDVPDMLNALGVPVKLHATRTRVSIDDLDAHFQKEFAAHGLFLPTDDAFDGTVPYRHVTGLDVDTNTSFSVIFQPNPDGSTTVLAGTAYLHAAKSPKEPPFVPAYPDARRVLVSRMETGATLSYAVDAKPEEVGAFYRELFTRAGYTESSPLQFERDGDVLTVFPQRKDGETAVIVLRATSPRSAGASP